MKKILFSVLAVAALAACTKSEVAYETPNEIALSPVASNVTKSVAGYTDGAFDGEFPTDIDLYVFANAGTGAVADHDEPYFQNALFEWNSGKGVEGTQGTPAVNTPGAYAGNPPRYWPNVKTLVFAGYSNACNVATLATKPSMDFDNNQLTITGYTQDNTKTAEGANDLMWFPCDGQAYSKQANEIAAQMKHACSWITINVAGDDVTAGNWTLNSLVVKTLIHSGSVVCDETTANWTLGTETADEDYYNDGTTFTKSYVKYEKNANNFIVLPQEPTYLEVKYTYTSDAANNLTLTETKSVPLKYAEVTVDGETVSKPWEPGVHYIYNVLITASEILIDPVVAEWDDQTYDLGNI